MSRLNLLSRLSKKGRERRDVTTMSDSTRKSPQEKTSSEYPALSSINCKSMFNLATFPHIASLTFCNFRNQAGQFELI